MTATAVAADERRRLAYDILRSFVVGQRVVVTRPLSGRVVTMTVIRSVHVLGGGPRGPWQSSRVTVSVPGRFSAEVSVRQLADGVVEIVPLIHAGPEVADHHVTCGRCRSGEHSPGAEEVAA